MSAALLLVPVQGSAAPAAAPPGLGLLGMAVLVVILVGLALALPRYRRTSRGVLPESEGSASWPTEEEVLAAVCAIHSAFAHLEQMEHIQMTMRMYEKPYRPWRLTGRAEFLIGRHSVQNRTRNRSR